MIRFLIFSDLHYDEVSDGDARIEEQDESYKGCERNDPDL